MRSRAFMFPLVASIASLRGNRKLRAYPGLTVTTSPRFPSFSTSSCKIICITDPFAPLVLCARCVLCVRVFRCLLVRFHRTRRCRSGRSAREGQERDVARALDGYAQPSLVPRANSGHTPRQDLSAFLDELRQNICALVIDQIDFLHTELADFLLAEILPLSART